MKAFAIFDRKLLKFILVGVINTVVGSTIIFILFNLVGFGYWLSSACGYIFTTILSFFLNKYFTFGVRHWSAFIIVAFIATIAFSYLVAYGIARPVVNFLLHDSSQWVRENVALLTGIFLFTGINYLGQRLIVFREKGAA